MAAKSSKGMASRLKREAALEAQQLAQKAEQENKTQDAIRSLVGPRRWPSALARRPDKACCTAARGGHRQDDRGGHQNPCAVQ